MKFEFNYDEEDDILSIYNYNLQPDESIEFSENLIIDINKEGFIVGIEILDANSFFNSMNESIDKNLLKNLESVEIIDKEFRNNWFIMLLLKSKGKEVIQQPMPLLRKSEYKSPLLLPQL